MKKETEEKAKTIIGIFAIIGVFSVMIFISNLFDKDNNASSCSEYESKIEDLETELENLKSDLSSEEYSNRELESNLESCKEELDICLDDCGCSSHGSAQLTDGPSGN